MFKINAKGIEVNITPKTLIVNRKSDEKAAEGGEKTSKLDTFELLTFKDQVGSESNTDKIKESK